MKTAFEKIAHFNELIGNGRNMAQAEQLKVQFEMIREEFEELEGVLDAYLSFNWALCAPEERGDAGEHMLTHIRDGIADVLVTTYGLAHRLGVDADADLDAVYASNMSKFVEGEKQSYAAQIEITQRLGIATTVAKTAPGLYAITSSRDQVGKDGKQYPKGKLLKPASYREPEFT